MIVLFTSVIALVGIVLVVYLWSMISKASAPYKLDKHRSKAPGVADLLNYAAVVDDGVIVNKNGSLMASFLYAGPDNASAAEYERELGAARINNAISQLGSGWMMHVDAVRRPSPSYSRASDSEFPDPISRAVDEERRRHFERLGTLYSGYFVVTFTWFPPLLAQRKFVELMFDDDAEKPNKQASTLALIERFKRSVNAISSDLSAAVSLERLGAAHMELEDGSVITQDQQLQWLQYCLTGINQPIQLPKNPIYIDALIGGQELYTGVIPRIGDKFIQVVCIEGFPSDSTPGILTTLGELPIEYRWSTRFIFLDRHEALKELESFRKRWKQKIRGFFDQVFNPNSDNVDEDAATMVGDASAAIAETNSGLVGQGYYTSVVVLFSEDRAQLERSSEFVRKAIGNMGFAARIEDINTMDAFLGSMPGHGVENIRRPILNSLNLSDLIPTSSLWTGENCAPSPLFPPNAPPLMHGRTGVNTPYYFNFHVRDLSHTTIFGPTRSGKSTLLGLLALQWRRYKDSRIFAFDKGMSMYPVCRAVGGDHYQIGPKAKVAFAPLSRLDTSSRRAWAAEWIETLLVLNGHIPSPAQRNLIMDALVQLSTSEARTLSEFSIQVQDATIREIIKPYTINGDIGYLMDAEEDNLELSSFMTFELERLMGMGERFALPVLLYLFFRIEEALDEGHGEPTLIILDEAWMMLGHEAFRDKIEEWLRSMAKKNATVVMATQGLYEAVQSGILGIIRESTSTKIFLPNAYAHNEDTAPIYKGFGLNDAQINLISSARAKRDYYATSEMGRALFQLDLEPLTLAIVGATDKESLAEISVLEDKHGDAWIYHWLRRKGINLEDYNLQDYGLEHLA